MIETLALRIAEALKKAEPDHTASVAVMKYSLEGILNTLLTLVLISIVSIATGAFLETILGVFMFIVLRFFSGGLHLRSAVNCSIVSTAILSIAPHIPLDRTGVIILEIISLVIILIFAPSNIQGHARIPEKYFPYLKLISALIVSSNFIFLSPTIAVVFLLQAITTIRFRKEVRL